MAVGYSSKFGTITSLNDLLSSKFKNAVALNGNPTSANAALNGVMMASMAEVARQQHRAGVSFFHRLKSAGNFSPCRRPEPRSRRARPRSCSTGTTSTCRATWACRTGRCSSRRTPCLAGTTRRPSIRTRRTRRRQAVGGVPLLAGQDGRAEPLAARGARPVEQTAMAPTAASTQARPPCCPRSPGRRRSSPLPGHRRRDLPGDELGEGRQLARERGCRCDN